MDTDTTLHACQQGTHAILITQGVVTEGLLVGCTDGKGGLWGHGHGPLGHRGAVLGEKVYLTLRLEEAKQSFQ